MTPAAAGTVTQPAGVLPGIVSSVAAGWTLTLVLLVPLMLQLVAAWIIRWRNALRSSSAGPGG